MSLTTCQGLSIVFFVKTMIFPVQENSSLVNAGFIDYLNETGEDSFQQKLIDIFKETLLADNVNF